MLDAVDLVKGPLHARREVHVELERLFGGDVGGLAVFDEADCVQQKRRVEYNKVSDRSWSWVPWKVWIVSE